MSTPAVRGSDRRADGSAVVRVEDAYLSVTRGLPEYSGLSERTLRGYLTHPSHPLPCYRIGGKVLVRRSDFDRWAEQFRAVSASVVDSLVSETLRGL
jgi:hypothetical protein